jgi:predicted XRE-type DNA-binding protein
MRKKDMKAKIETTITKRSDDVFADLGFSPAESRNLPLRSQMMTALGKFIEKEGLTQADAAKRLKVSQPRISDLTRGKISRFSLDTLVNMLSDAGLEVDFRIKTAIAASCLAVAAASRPTAKTVGFTNDLR